jgi:chemotaxis protein MotB
MADEEIPPKKCECPEHANHERWVISFADFMTLLFALFVVLYATSQADMKKLRKVSASMGRAFGPSVGLGPSATVPAEDDRFEPDAKVRLDSWRYAPIFGGLPEDVDDPVRKAASMVALKKELDRALAATGLRGRASSAVGENGVVLAFSGDGLFLPGGSELVAGASTVLATLADHLKRRGGALVIEATISRGHQALSAAREAMLMQEFVDKRRVAKDKIVTVGRPAKGHAKWGKGVRLRIMLIAWEG